MKIVPGQTTQPDVVRAFGAPNIVMMGSNRAETWTYDRVAVFQSRVSGDLNLGAGFFVIHPAQPSGYGGGGTAGYGRGKSMSSVRTATLLIEFDDKGVVTKYEMMSTAF